MSPIAVALSTLDWARVYVRRAWSVVPVPFRQKAPRLDDWTSLRLSEAELQEHFDGDCNVGVILGDASDGLVDVDVDAPEALPLARRFLPPTSLVHGRASKPSSHFWYVAHGSRTAKFTDIDGTMLIESRSTGQQTLVPPSIHPSGESLAWELGGAPATVEPQELHKAVALCAACALVARHWPAKGSRHHAANALAGMLLRTGWSRENTASFVRGVAEAAHDEEVDSRVADVTTTANRVASDRPATGTPTLAVALGDAAAQYGNIPTEFPEGFSPA